MFAISKALTLISFFKHRIMLSFKYNLTRNKIRLEACNLCQLSCPCCSNKKIKDKGYLKFNDFQRLLEANPTIKEVELSNWGEIFLNPELEPILRYASERHITLSANNGVNLNYVSENVLEALVKYRFSSLLVSIDGASQNTYKIYRQGGNFNTVIEHIKRINRFKKKYQTELPFLTWQFILFGHNEYELPQAQQMADDLNMCFRIKLNHSPDFSPIKNKIFLRQYSTFLSRAEYEAKTGQLYSNPCKQLWSGPQINWDGKLLGCCINKFSDFGNVFENGLEQCLKSEKYRYAKKMLLGIEKPREDIPCYSCRYYQKIKTSNKYLRQRLHRKALKYFHALFIKSA